MIKDVDTNIAFDLSKELVILVAKELTTVSSSMDELAVAVAAVGPNEFGAKGFG